MAGWNQTTKHSYTEVITAHIHPYKLHVVFYISICIVNTQLYTQSVIVRLYPSAVSCSVHTPFEKDSTHPQTHNTIFVKRVVYFNSRDDVPYKLSVTLLSLFVL